MRALLTPDLAATLPLRNVQIWDTQIRGFLIRCRSTGVHSYRIALGRGHTVTIGRVGAPADGGITVAAARTVAAKLRGDTDHAALAARGADSALTLAEAKAQAQAAVTARRQSRVDRATTLRTYLTETYGPWVTAHKKTGAETLARLLATFPDLLETPLAELSAFTIERWRTKRLNEDDVTPATVNRDLAALRGALSRAVEWGRLTAHPMRTVKAAKTDPIGHIRFLTAAEATRLRAALLARDERRQAERTRANAWRRQRGQDPYPAFGPYTDHVTPLVLSALNTGLRRGELLALTWRDLDLSGARLTVRAGAAKGGRARVVPLNTEVVRVLRAWRPVGVALEAPVFASSNGQPLQGLKSAWHALMRAAKITRFRFHDCRHDFASQLVQAGVDLNTVRELLGHTDLKMTLRYAHLAPEHKAAAVAKLVRA